MGGSLWWHERSMVRTVAIIVDVPAIELIDGMVSM